MKNTILFILLLGVLTSCQKLGLKEYTDDTHFISFTKDFTKDSTLVSFLFFQDDTIQFPIEMKLAGALTTENKEYSLVVMKDSTTLNAKNYILPEKFIFRAGRLTDSAYITFIKTDELASNVYKLVLQVVENEDFKTGPVINRKSKILVTNKIAKPTWWSEDTEIDVVWYYFGKYSEKKYLLLLELSEGMDFEGAEAFVFRKYALILKRYVSEYNAAHPGEPMMDEENKEPMTIPVAG